MTDSATTAEAKLVEYLAFHIDASPKSRNQIAKECGFERANVISMIKSGQMRVPLAAVPRIAKALDIDPAGLMRRCCNVYQPELLAAIDACLGPIVTQNELKVLEIYRRATNNTDPRLAGPTQEAEFERLIQSLFVAHQAKPPITASLSSPA
jgi:hypothetical protein